MSKEKIDNVKVLKILNKILETELAGVVRYTHYSLMVYGFNRIPIVSWLRSQTDEGLLHAYEAGDLITSLGGHPSLNIGSLLETHKHDIGDILNESLAHEEETLKMYEELLDLVQDKSVWLEEYTRQMIFKEKTHLNEVNKMLREPG